MDSFICFFSELSAYDKVSLFLSGLSVLLGFISIFLTHSVKKAVALTEDQIYLQNLKMDLSIRISKIGDGCTEENIRNLYGLLQEIYTNPKLPNHESVRSNRESLEYYVKHNLPTGVGEMPGGIVKAYKDAYASAKNFIHNIDPKRR